MSEIPLLREYLNLQAEVATRRLELAAKEEELRAKRQRLERVAGLPATTVEVEHTWETHQPAPAMRYSGAGQFLGAVTVATPMRTFTYTTPGASFFVTATPTLAARVLDCLRQHGGAMSPSAVAAELGESPNVVRATLSRLANEDKIDRLGHGQYRAFDASQGALAFQY